MKLKALVKLVREAVRHGGDSGGPYHTNKEDLYNALEDFLEKLGEKNYEPVFCSNEFVGLYNRKIRSFITDLDYEDLKYYKIVGGLPDWFNIDRIMEDYELFG